MRSIVKAAIVALLLRLPEWLQHPTGRFVRAAWGGFAGV